MTRISKLVVSGGAGVTIRDGKLVCQRPTSCKFSAPPSADTETVTATLSSRSSAPSSSAASGGVKNYAPCGIAGDGASGTVFNFNGGVSITSYGGTVIGHANNVIGGRVVSAADVSPEVEDDEFKKEWDTSMYTLQLSEVDIGGAGRVVITARDQIGATLEVDMSGAGCVVIGGNAAQWEPLKELEVDISGAGKADFGNICAEIAYVTVSGAGRVEKFTVSETAKLRVSGVGRISGKKSSGSVRVKKSVSGLGSIDM